MGIEPSTRLFQLNLIGIWVLHSTEFQCISGELERTVGLK